MSQCHHVLKSFKLFSACNQQSLCWFSVTVCKLDYFKKSWEGELPHPSHPPTVPVITAVDARHGTNQADKWSSLPDARSGERVSWWCQDREKITMLLALCEGNPPGTGGFPSQRASNVALWCPFAVSIRCWTNSWDVSDLRFHDTHVITL